MQFQWCSSEDSRALRYDDDVVLFSACEWTGHTVLHVLWANNNLFSLTLQCFMTYRFFRFCWIGKKNTWIFACETISRNKANQISNLAGSILQCCYHFHTFVANVNDSSRANYIFGMHRRDRCKRPRMLESMRLHKCLSYILKYLHSFWHLTFIFYPFITAAYRQPL